MTPGGGQDAAMSDALTDDERHLLRTALDQWGGPARPTDALAVALGFTDVDDFYSETRKVAALLAGGGDLSPLDATRVLAAAEVVFASDVFGAGVEWETVTGFSDAETIAALRGIQRKLVGGYGALTRQ
jgi:hypothetical protein